MSDLKPEYIPTVPLEKEEIPTVPDFDLVRGEVESRAHHTLAMQGMVARGALPLVEIIGKGAHRPNEQIDKTLKSGERVHAEFDARGRVTAVDLDNGRLIEHVDFDSHGRITRDALHGEGTNSAVFQYDSHRHVREATISMAGEVDAFALDEKGNVLYSRWQTNDGAVDQFNNNAGTKAISNMDPQGVATTFKYDLNNQFEEGQVIRDHDVTVIRPGPDGVPRIATHGGLT